MSWVPPGATPEEIREVLKNMDESRKKNKSKDVLVPKSYFKFKPHQPRPDSPNNDSWESESVPTPVQQHTKISTPFDNGDKYQNKSRTSSSSLETIINFNSKEGESQIVISAKARRAMQDAIVKGTMNSNDGNVTVKKIFEPPEEEREVQETPEATCTTTSVLDEREAHLRELRARITNKSQYVNKVENVPTDDTNDNYNFRSERFVPKVPNSSNKNNKPTKANQASTSMVAEYEKFVNSVSKPLNPRSLVNKATMLEASSRSESVSQSETIASTLKGVYTLVDEKLKFFCDNEVMKPPQILAVQIETMKVAWEAKAISTEYFEQWLKYSKTVIGSFEKKDVPAGWLYEWDRSVHRYYYREMNTGKIQWEHPTKSESIVSDAPPPPPESPPPQQPPPPSISPPVEENETFDSINGVMDYEIEPTSNAYVKQEHLDITDEPINGLCEVVIKDEPIVDIPMDLPMVGPQNEYTSTDSGLGINTIRRSPSPKVLPFDVKLERVDFGDYGHNNDNDINFEEERVLEPEKRRIHQGKPTKKIKLDPAATRRNKDLPNQLQKWQSQSWF